MDDYHYERIDEYIQCPAVDVHHVPVEFEGYRIPRLFALIGAYREGCTYTIVNRSIGKYATETLQARGRLPPFERVGNPDCRRGLCILTGRYSDAPEWRQATLLVPDAARAFSRKKRQLDYERKGVAAWSAQKDLATELQYLIEQFVGPAPNWSTWLLKVTKTSTA